MYALFYTLIYQKFKILFINFLIDLMNPEWLTNFEDSQCHKNINIKWIYLDLQDNSLHERFHYRYELGIDFF